MGGKAPKTDDIKDEPGAEERFDRILGRVLTTPPKRKAAERATRPAASSKKGKK